MKKKLHSIKSIWAVRNGSLIDCTNHLPCSCKSLTSLGRFSPLKTLDYFSTVCKDMGKNCIKCFVRTQQTFYGLRETFDRAFYRRWFFFRNFLLYVLICKNTSTEYMKDLNECDDDETKKKKTYSTFNEVNWKRLWNSKFESIQLQYANDLGKKTLKHYHKVTVRLSNIFIYNTLYEWFETVILVVQLAIIEQACFSLLLHRLNDNICQILSYWARAHIL